MDLQLLVSEDCNRVLVEYPELALESEFSLWQYFCKLYLITAIADQTNLYANRNKNKPHFFVTPAELAKFFGILLLSGYNSLERPIIGRTSLT